MQRQVLIVRHGPGLGRKDHYLQAAFDHLRADHPAIASRIRIHETGAGSPSLDDVAAVVFLLGDPLREFYPKCYAEAVQLAERARSQGIRILNAPEALSNSVKSVQSRIWRDAGIATPEYERFETYEELRALVERIPSPFLVRSDQEHARAGLRVCASRKDLDAIDSRDIALPGAIAPLLDIRSGFRPRDPRARYYHKKRVLVMDRVLRTKHLMFAEDPIVGSKTSIFARYDSRHTFLHWRAALHPAHWACVQADLAYWRRGSEHEELMLRAMHTLGLEFAAIDYSDMADGTVMLWEANPHPELPALEKLKMPRIRMTRERLTSYYEAIGRFVADLAPTISSAPK
jgi:hypothetical protein